ncbi:MAG: transposase, partial [Erysipelotrichaceae bacterium]|nr:transposase [Erysipelotrichaceae bacterium]
MIQHKGYKYRIYPNKAQAVILSRFFGCCRFVYNRCLSYRKEVYTLEKRNVSQYECMRLVTEMRHDPDYAWLASCDSMSLQESIKDLSKAFANFFEKRGGYPKFHKKSSVQTYRTRNQSGGIRIEENRIVLPKLGAIKAKISRCLKGRILSATVSRTATGKYFVSLCCEEELIPKPNAKGMIGIDLGIKELYVDSNNCHEPNHKYLSKYEQKLHREQRSLSRMIEVNIADYTKERKPIWKRPLSECSNMQKQKQKIARIHEKIYNCRNDHLHKVSSKLVNENQVIALETLNVKGMVRN